MNKKSVISLLIIAGIVGIIGAATNDVMYAALGMAGILWGIVSSIRARSEAKLLRKAMGE